MPKYKIHIDPKLPGPEQIARHKDFKKLYGDYQTATRFRFWRELRTNPRYFATLVMIVAVGALVWQAFQSDEKKAKPFINPPFAVQNIPYQEVLLDAETGKDIKMDLLQIKVPPLAWADSSGEAINEGEIRLAYRVLKDPADFFMAGLPMHFVGSEKYLEASPVIELRAYRGEESIQLRKGVAVNMAFDGSSKDSVLSVFYLSEREKGWAAWQEPERELLFDEEAILASLPNKPRLRSIRSDGEVPLDELRPKGVGASAPVAQGSSNADENDYRRRLADWEHMRDAALAAARDSAALRMRFQASRLGYFGLGEIFDAEVSKHKIKLVNQQGKRIGPKLHKADETVYLYEPGVSTLRPCRYNGEGKHWIERSTEGEAMLWMRLPDGQMGVTMIYPDTEEATVKASVGNREGLLLLVK
jgi:hypothetical protein